MKNLNNPLIDQFIIEVSLIKPIIKILDQLNKGEYRDCDIKWLDKKLEDFVEFAAKTIGINCVFPQRESVKPAYMNSYAVEYYGNYFNYLLIYFKNI